MISVKVKYKAISIIVNSAKNYVKGIKSMASNHIISFERSTVSA